MPPSITFWNRLEPRPYANSIAESLAAPIRDPLWMLARQWQLGEFCASDSGSPVYIDLKAQAGPFVSWRSGSSTHSLSGPLPMETELQSEPFLPDLATRVELGQWYESLLGQNPGAHMIDDLRSSYPLPVVLDQNNDRRFGFNGSLTGLDGGIVPAALLAAFQADNISLPSYQVWTVTPGAQWVITNIANRLNYAVVNAKGVTSVYLCRDLELLRFLRVCAGRAADGAAILQAVLAGTAILPPRAEWSAAQIQAITDAGHALLDAVRAVYGSIGSGDPPAWNRAHLALELNVDVTSSSSTTDTLKATPGDNGEFDWTSFDLAIAHGTGATPGPVTDLSKTAVPGHVRFRGMPESRWWEFETSQTDFGAIQPEKRDLAKLIFMDFMLIHGDDWYLLPLDVPIGSIAMIGGLTVHDVFGVVTQINRADAGISAAAPGQQWTMFSPASLGQQPYAPQYMVVPPSAWPVTMPGPVVEEVRLVRDPVADLVWAIETKTENGVGQPWPGRERQQGGKPSQAPSAAASAQPSLSYKLHTPVPVNWFPYVPVPQNSGYVLERANLPGDDVQAIAPSGRILNATEIREQEISTQGTVVSRCVCRARWIDGSTRLWIARRRNFGLGQTSNGIRFDIADWQ